MALKFLALDRQMHTDTHRIHTDHYNSIYSLLKTLLLSLWLYRGRWLLIKTPTKSTSSYNSILTMTALPNTSLRISYFPLLFTSFYPTYYFLCKAHLISVAGAHTSTHNSLDNLYFCTFSPFILLTRRFLNLHSGPVSVLAPTTFTTLLHQATQRDLT